MNIHLATQEDFIGKESMIFALREGENKHIPDEVQKVLDEYASKELFTGKIGSSMAFNVFLDKRMVEVGVFGVGTEKTFSNEGFRKGLANAYKLIKAKKVTNLILDVTALKGVTPCEKRLSRMISESLVLADYNFNDYLSDAKVSTLEDVYVWGEKLHSDAFTEGLVLGEATVFGRKLTNMPANVMTPAKLAELAVDYAKQSSFDVVIKEVDEIKALGMEAFLAVAQGSTQPPKLIVMSYNGDPGSEKRLGFVGKGLTYDSGGLSIKPTASMLNMKDDMGGASAVIATMGAIARLKLKINVTAVVAACENMISGACYKPGDIIQSMGKKSIFIGNTDAEGRLTLVDAVTYIQEHEQVTHVVDVATLTGAAVMCLGSEATAVISNDDTFYLAVERAFDKADEHVWRMPMFDAYKALLKHEYADLTNAAGAPGMITAGMFIGEFIKDRPWVHMDIAGTAFLEKADGIYSKGGTGVAVRPLYFLAKKMSK